MEERTTSSILKKYLFSYIFIFSIPFIVFLLIINNIYIQDVKEETSLGNQEQLEQANILLNEQLVEIKTLGNYIATKNSFNRYTPYIKDEFNVYKEIIRQHEVTTSSIDGLYVVYNNGERVFSSQGTTSLKALYGSNPRFSKIKNEEEFEENFSSGNEGFFVYGQNIYYTMSLGSPKNNTGIVLVDLNTQLINDSLRTMNRNSQGIALLMDADSNLLLAPNSDMLLSQEEISEASKEILTQNEFKLNGKKYFSEKIVNELTSWSFVMLTDARSYNQPFYQVIIFSIVVVILILSFGLFFSYYFAKKNYQPLQELLINMELSDGTVDNEWSIIEKNLRKTYSEVESLNSLVDQQTPIVRNAALLDLIKGDLQTKENMTTNLQELNIEFPYPHLAVAIMEFDEAHMDLAGVIQQQRIQKNMDMRIKDEEYHVDFAMPYLNNHQIFLILNLKNDTKEAWKYVIDKMQLNFKKIRSLNDANYTFVVGSTYQEISNVKKSYIEASTALEAASKSPIQNNVIFYDEIDEKLNKRNQDATLEYPTKSLLLLLQSIKKTNYTVAKEMLTNIFGQIEQDYSDGMIRRVLILYVFNNIVELSQELELEDYFYYLYELEQITDLDAAWNLLDKLIHSICLEIEDKEKKASEELGEEISAYVYEHFASPDISLEKIAEKFQVSISYVSQLVKEETGETFSIITQNLRMDKFKELLISTSKPINQLVKDIGYFDASNFSRKFRQENNMTPSQYRKKYQETN